MTSDIDSLDDDFDLDEGFDLSDYEAKQGFSVVPAGTFDCEVVAVKPAKTAEGKRQVYFEYEVKAGEHEGSTFREYFAMDSDDGKSYLKGRFYSLGCDEGQGKYLPADVVGDQCTVIRTERQGTGKHAGKSFVNVSGVALKTEPVKAKTSTAKGKSGGDLLG